MDIPFQPLSKRYSREWPTHGRPSEVLAFIDHALDPPDKIPLPPYLSKACWWAHRDRMLAAQRYLDEHAVLLRQQLSALKEIKHGHERYIETLG